MTLRDENARASLQAKPILQAKPCQVRLCRVQLWYRIRTYRRKGLPGSLYLLSSNPPAARRGGGEHRIPPGGISPFDLSRPAIAASDSSWPIRPAGSNVFLDGQTTMPKEAGIAYHSPAGFPTDRPFSTTSPAAKPRCTRASNSCYERFLQRFAALARDLREQIVSLRYGILLHDISAGSSSGK